MVFGACDPALDSHDVVTKDFGLLQQRQNAGGGDPQIGHTIGLIQVTIKGAKIPSPPNAAVHDASGRSVIQCTQKRGDSGLIAGGRFRRVSLLCRDPLDRRFQQHGPRQSPLVAKILERLRFDREAVVRSAEPTRPAGPIANETARKPRHFAHLAAVRRRAIWQDVDPRGRWAPSPASPADGHRTRHLFAGSEPHRRPVPTGVQRMSYRSPAATPDASGRSPVPARSAAG